jgi:hypothetical protein
VMYTAAREAGAVGGKLLGAGGGGFLLLFVPPDRRAAVQMALGHLTELPISLGASGCQILQQDSRPFHEHLEQRPVYPPAAHVFDPYVASSPIPLYPK